MKTMSLCFSLLLSFGFSQEIRANLPAKCHGLYTDLGEVSSKPKAGRKINDKKTIAARLQVYREHQNQLRAQVGLPLISQKSIDEAVSRYHESPRSKNSRNGFISGVQRMNYEKENWLLPWPRVDDWALLNYAYEFKGVKLVNAIPALEYFLQRHPSETITLFRAVGDLEYKYWNNKDVAALKEKAKTLQQWGYDRPRLHFAADSPARLYALTVSIVVPKAVLMEWGRRGLVSIGKEGLVTEIVLLEDVWDEMIKYTPTSG